jgi:hypothetical protein
MAPSRRSTLVRSFILVAVVLCGTSIGLPFDDRNQMALRSLDAGPLAVGEPTTMRSPGDAPVVIQHDDGTVESAFGITDRPPTFGNQGVFLNRFTIPDELLPFSIDTVSILFPVSTASGGPTGIIPGSTFEIVVYVDETGSGNPDVTQLKVQRSFAVQPSNTVFQEVATGAPVTIQSGDVWIGFTNTVTATDNRPIFPAAADTNAPQGRSWAFFNGSAGEHFSGPLANAERAEIVQANWLIRATGQQGGSTCVRWDAPGGAARGTLPPPINTRLCDTVPPVTLTEEPESPGAVMGYNVYRSNSPGVQTTPANFFTSTPPTQTNTGSSVAPGGSFFVVTAMYPGGESGPSSEFSILPPTLTKVNFKNGKLNAKGVNFTPTVQVFVDGIPFVNPPAVKKNNTKVVQLGTLITGETFDVYLAQHGNRVRIDFRNNNGALTSVDFSR